MTALSDRRKIAAANLLDRSVAETSASALQAENSKLEAEIRQQQLKEQMTKPADDGWRDYLLQHMDSLQTELNETRKALSEQQLAAMQDRFTMLQAELERIRAGAPEGPKSDLTRVKDAIEDARGILEFVNPSPIPPPPSTGGGADAALHAWTLRSQLDHERWKAERADQQTARMAEIELKKLEMQERIALERERGAKMDRFVEKTAPEFLELAKLLMARFLGAGGDAAAGMAGSPPAVAVASPSMAVPLPPAPAAAAMVAAPGVVSAACGQCGNSLLYRAGTTEVICQRCGTVWRVQAKPDGQTAPAAGLSAAVAPGPVAQMPEEEGMIG